MMLGNYCKVLHFSTKGRNGWETRRKVLRGRIAMEFYASPIVLSGTVMVFALRSELFMIVQGKSQGLLLR